MAESKFDSASFNEFSSESEEIIIIIILLTFSAPESFVNESGSKEVKRKESVIAADDNVWLAASLILDDADYYRVRPCSPQYIICVFLIQYLTILSFFICCGPVENVFVEYTVPHSPVRPFDQDGRYQNGGVSEGGRFQLAACHRRVQFSTRKSAKRR